MGLGRSAAGPTSGRLCERRSDTRNDRCEMDASSPKFIGGSVEEIDHQETAGCTMQQWFTQSISGILILGAAGSILGVAILKATSVMLPSLKQEASKICRLILLNKLKKIRADYIDPAQNIIRADTTGRILTAYTSWHVAVFLVNIGGLGVWTVVTMLSIFYLRVAFLTIIGFAAWVFFAYHTILQLSCLVCIYDDLVSGPLKREIQRSRVDALYQR